MKRIKKILAMIMIVAVMFGGIVFGADTSQEFEITTTIPAMAELKIHTAEISTISGFNSVTTVAGHAFAITGYETADTPTTEKATFYALIKTNAKADTTLKATFANMGGETTGNTSEISYTFTLGSETPVLSTDTETTVVKTISPVIGATVVPTIFTIKLTDTGTDSIQSAEIDSYSATITFEYTAS